MLNSEIQNSDDASNIIIGFLAKKGIEVEKVFTHRNKSGSHINLIDKKNNMTYHVKFATEPFFTFGTYFPEYKGEVGETLDEKVINNLKSNDVLFFAYPQRILKCTVGEFVKPNLWRITKSGTKTCSFPLVNLEEFNM